MQVYVTDDCIGPDVAQKAASLKDGEVSLALPNALLLNFLRF